ENYWHAKILPFVDDRQIVFIGNCGPEKRNQILGGARALLHHINFDEPFGMSVAESMACGTPVIAFNRGAMPGLIWDGNTGYLVKDVSEAVQAVKALPGIRRIDCRSRVEQLFSTEKMTSHYLQVYGRILSRMPY